MSDRTEQLTALLERVKAAVGPDREIDVRLVVLVRDRRELREDVHPEFGPQIISRNPKPPHDENWADHPTNSVPPYTASIDSALALVERVLPMTLWATGSMEDGPFCQLVVPTEGGSYAGGDHRAYAETPALAILAALLTALIAQEKAS